MYDVKKKKYTKQVVLLGCELKCMMCHQNVPQKSKKEEWRLREQ